MIVCDVCKNTAKEAFDIRLVTLKTDPPKKGRKKGEREMISIPVHVCESCTDDLHKALGRFVNQMRRGNYLPKQFEESGDR